MGEEPRLNYKLPKRIVFMTSLIFPLFFILGAIFDTPGQLELIVYPDLLIYLALAILLLPFVYLAFSFYPSIINRSLKKSKINWSKWEKLGRRKFIAFRICYYMLLGFIISSVEMVAYNWLFNRHVGLMVVAIVTYLGFAIALISGVSLWDIRQLHKNRQEHRAPDLPAGI